MTNLLLISSPIHLEEKNYQKITRERAIEAKIALQLADELLYSHPQSAGQCIDTVWRRKILITYLGGS